MAICCGKIDESMRASKLKSFFYFILFMGYFSVVMLVMVLWSLVRFDLKSIRNIIVSFWFLFLLQSRKLTVVPTEIKTRTAGKLFRVSPFLSGYIFKHFDSIFMLSILSILVLIIYVIIL